MCRNRSSYHAQNCMLWQGTHSTRWPKAVYSARLVESKPVRQAREKTVHVVGKFKNPAPCLSILVFGMLSVCLRILHPFMYYTVHYCMSNKIDSKYCGSVHLLLDQPL